MHSKRTVVAAVVAIVAAVAFTSCDKEVSGITGEVGNYTLGNYHPSKHIDSIVVVYESDNGNTIGSAVRYDLTYKFTWNCNQLGSITRYYCCRKRTTISLNENANLDWRDPVYDTNVYTYTYGSNGYITNVGSKSVGYGPNVVSLFGKDVVVNEIWDGMSDSYDGIFRFDDNGVLFRIDNDEVSMSGGNPSQIAYSSLSCDTHPNPFKDLIPPYGLYKYLSMLGLEHAIVSLNNCCKSNGYFIYESDAAGSYPTDYYYNTSSSYTKSIHIVYVD